MVHRDRYGQARGELLVVSHSNLCPCDGNLAYLTSSDGVVSQFESEQGHINARLSGILAYHLH